MQTCPDCGAHIADDLDWCNQCYAALARTPKPPEEPSPVDDDRPLWVRSGTNERRLETHTEFSRWRGGATSFGPIGRTLLTLGVIVMLIIGYPLLRGLIYAVGGVDIPGVGLIGLYACAALPAGAYMLSRVWKRERIA